MEPKQKRQLQFSSWFLVAAFVLLWLIYSVFLQQIMPKVVPYNERDFLRDDVLDVEELEVVTTGDDSRQGRLLFL